MFTRDGIHSFTDDKGTTAPSEESLYPPWKIKGSVHRVRYALVYKHGLTDGKMKRIY